MRHYFKKVETGYEEIDVNSLPYDKYEWERHFTAKKMANVMISSNSQEMVEKILNNDPSIDIVEITCSMDTELMERNEALAFYLECMQGSEGSERSRYTDIYCGLMAGEKKVSDDI